MKVFQASIEQMLWPERRRNDELFTGLKIEGPGIGWIQRTTTDSFIRVPEGYLPDGLRPLLGIGRRLFPFLFRNGEVSIGPIPKGTPVSLVTSMDLLGADKQGEERQQHREQLLRLLKQIKAELKRGNNAFADRNVLETMLAMSNCPDFVINKGHYFGTNLFTEEPGLNDAEKRDLIGFLKTM
jgi:hypothetical protein